MEGEIEGEKTCMSTQIYKDNGKLCEEINVI